MAKPATKPTAAAPAAAPAKTELKTPIAPTPALAKSQAKAFTVERGPGGWVMVTLTYEPATGQVVNLERTQPDLKVITLEKFKLASFKYWSNIA